MRVTCLGIALLCSACGTAEAVVAPPPEPLPVPSVPAPEPPVASPSVVDSPPVLLPPEAPPPPRGSILSQSVYPVLDVTQWTLPNGTVVAYKQLEGSESFAMRAVAEGGWAMIQGPDSLMAAARRPRAWGGDDLRAVLGATERRIDAEGSDLESLVAGAVRVFEQSLAATPVQRTAVDALHGARAGDPLIPDPIRHASVFSDVGDFTILIAGPASAERVASLIGRHLSPLTPRLGLTFSADPTPASSPYRGAGEAGTGALDLALRISARTGDAAPLAVLRNALDASLQSAGIGTVHVQAEMVPWQDAAWLRVHVDESALAGEALEAAIRDALTGDALLVSRARRALLRELRTPTVHHWVDALTQLYRDGDGRQPGQNPAALSPLSAPISRVTDSDVQTLARRFASATDSAILFSP